MSRLDGKVPLSSGNKQIDASIAEAVKQPVSVLPIDTEITGVYRAGLKDGFYIQVTFNVAQNVEVQVDNPLDRVPEIYFLATLPDRDRANVYMDANWSGATNPCTWSEDTLGFKVDIDTSSESMTVLIYIE